MSKSPLPPADTFAIEFFTKEVPGFMTVYEVTLRRRHIPNSQADSTSFRIDLRDHPIYPALQRYVKANPRDE